MGALPPKLPYFRSHSERLLLSYLLSQKSHKILRAKMLFNTNPQEFTTPATKSQPVTKKPQLVEEKITFLFPIKWHPVLTFGDRNSLNCSWLFKKSSPPNDCRCSLNCLPVSKLQLVHQREAFIDSWPLFGDSTQRWGRMVIRPQMSCNSGIYTDHYCSAVKNGRFKKFACFRILLH